MNQEWIRVINFAAIMFAGVFLFGLGFWIGGYFSHKRNEEEKEEEKDGS